MKMTSRLFTSLIVSFVCSCDSKDEFKAAKQEAVQDKVVQKENYQMNEKLNIYVGCINETEPEVMRGIEMYKSWVDFDKGPNDKGSVSGIIAVDPEHNFYKPCFEGLNKAVSLAPKEEGLDKAGVAYKVALEELGVIAKEAAKYYRHNDYEDDDFKKGKELHPKLVSSIEKFLSARTGLHENLDRVTDKRRAAKLFTIEKKEGRKIAFHRLNLMGEAKRLLSKIHSTDADVLAKARDRFAKAYEEAEAFTKANPELAESVKGWKRLVFRAENLYIAFKNLTRIHTKEPTPAELRRWDKHVARAVKEVISDYNKLITQSNKH